MNLPANHGCGYAQNKQKVDVHVWLKNYLCALPPSYTGSYYPPITLPMIITAGYQRILKQVKGQARDTQKTIMKRSQFLSKSNFISLALLWDFHILHRVTKMEMEGNLAYGPVSTQSGQVAGDDVYDMWRPLANYDRKPYTSDSSLVFSHRIDKHSKVTRLSWVDWTLLRKRLVC
jgi:hypothetical protein